MNNENGRMIKSCGNIFKDLGFSDENLRIRTLLMLKAKQFIKRQEVTQYEVSERLDMTQSEVRDLLSGKLDAFTIDTLVNMLARLGLRVDVTVQWEDAA